MIVTHYNEVTVGVMYLNAAEDICNLLVVSPVNNIKGGVDVVSTEDEFFSTPSQRHSIVWTYSQRTCTARGRWFN